LLKNAKLINLAFVTKGILMRAGARALSLISVPLNLNVLEALAEEQRPPIDLRRAVGSPPQSTMRAYLRNLVELGVVDHAAAGDSSGYTITRSGQTLLEVSEILRAWLELAPEGPIELGSTAGRSTVKALLDGWSSHITRALAARPLSLTELDGLIQRISYPSLERRLSAMRLAEMVERCQDEGRARPYGASEWLRRSVAPIASGIGWERRNVPEGTAPIGRLDVEALFLLAVPLMELDPGVSGKCRLAVEMQREHAPVFAGVLICVESGQVTSCAADLQGETEAWASGPPLAWLRRMSGQDCHLEIGGDAPLAEAITDGLRRTAAVPK
jgi:DNA-binding HxlR family transcriptional regulator